MQTARVLSADRCCISLDACCEFGCHLYWTVLYAFLRLFSDLLSQMPTVVIQPSTCMVACMLTALVQVTHCLSYIFEHFKHFAVRLSATLSCSQRSSDLSPVPVLRTQPSLWLETLALLTALLVVITTASSDASRQKYKTWASRYDNQLQGLRAEANVVNTH